MWNIEKGKDREKEKTDGRPAKLVEKKGDRDLEREMKNNGDIFLLGERHENFVTAATNARWKGVAVKKQWTITRTTFPP